MNPKSRDDQRQSVNAGATTVCVGVTASTQDSSSEIVRLRSLLQTTEAARDEYKKRIIQLEDEVALIHCHQCAGYLDPKTCRCIECDEADARFEAKIATLEFRLSSLTQAHARLRTAAQGVLDRNGGPADTPYGPFVFVARDDFDAMGAALKADDLAGRGQSAEDGAAVQLARLTQAQQRLIAEWHDREADILEGGYECSSAGTDEPLIAAELAGKLHGVRQCIADLAAVAETTEGQP